MRKLCSEAEKIMIERFGKDTVIALATVEQEVPYVRKVNAYYEDGSLWIDNGHNDFDDENTIILCVELTDGLLLSHGTRYEF